jgi:hypothetical protein
MKKEEFLIKLAANTATQADFEAYHTATEAAQAAQLDTVLAQHNRPRGEKPLFEHLNEVIGGATKAEKEAARLAKEVATHQEKLKNQPDLLKVKADFDTQLAAETQKLQGEFTAYKTQALKREISALAGSFKIKPELADAAKTIIAHHSEMLATQYDWRETETGERIAYKDGNPIVKGGGFLTPQMALSEVVKSFLVTENTGGKDPRPPANTPPTTKVASADGREAARQAGVDLGTQEGLKWYKENVEAPK